jgi:hypothetical protein
LPPSGPYGVALDEWTRRRFGNSMIWAEGNDSVSSRRFRESMLSRQAMASSIKPTNPPITENGRSHLVDDIEADLRSLGQLSPNWDGYGAPAIDPAVIAAVRSFVARLPQELAPRPRVVPMSNGMVQLEWHAGPRSLELEFESPDSIRYLRWDPEEGIEDEESFPAAEVNIALDLIRWFVNGLAL